MLQLPQLLVVNPNQLVALTQLADKQDRLLIRRNVFKIRQLAVQRYLLGYLHQGIICNCCIVLCHYYRW